MVIFKYTAVGYPDFESDLEKFLKRTKILPDSTEVECRYFNITGGIGESWTPAKRKTTLGRIRCRDFGGLTRQNNMSWSEFIAGPFRPEESTFSSFYGIGPLPVGCDREKFREKRLLGLTAFIPTLPVVEEKINEGKENRGS